MKARLSSTSLPMLMKQTSLVVQDSAVRNIADQWMMGDALMVSPIMDPSTSTRSAYFPAGMWYSLYDGTPIDTTNGGKTVTLQVRSMFILT